MPATKKRPPLELEPGEGKAHEMAESTNEELREGAEPDDAPRARSRKRSAKGAKRTKAPMDGEACCAACAAGKPCSGKAKKDGGCGKRMADGDCPMGKADCEGCPMKKSATDCATCSKRGDSLTPQEYLAACELGIQDRSKVYIRARLDTAERLDLKCGAGSISPGEKCHKGQATKAATDKPSRRAQVENFLVKEGKSLAFGTGLASIAANLSGKHQLGRRLGQVSTASSLAANTALISRGHRTGNGNEMAAGAVGLGLTAGLSIGKQLSNRERVQAFGKRRAAISSGETTKESSVFGGYMQSKFKETDRAALRSTMNAMKASAPLSAARRRKAQASGKTALNELGAVFGRKPGTNRSSGSTGPKHSFEKPMGWASSFENAQRNRKARKPGGWRAPDRSLLDSAWASGFSPELDQLSV